MEKKHRQLYEFGSFRLDAGERLLLRAGEAVPLAPKTFDVLLAFVEQPGHLLEKDVLLKTIWPDSFVEENNLTDNIFRLRKALGEGEKGRKFIETIPKRGYRFVADVKVVNRDSDALTVPVASFSTGLAATPTTPNPSESVAALPPAPMVTPLRRPTRPGFIFGVFGLLLLTLASLGLYLRFKPESRAESLAVLPFSADPQTEYLADGITESLINNLSRLSNLRVTARATAFSYKGKEANPQQIGQALNVGTVLTGRVALRDDILTVQVDLVDTATGTQKWGEHYQRKLSDIFVVQEEIGRQITDKLRLRLSGEEQRQLTQQFTENAEGYQLYLQGLYLFGQRTEDGLHKAIAYFQQAIAKDPNYALAYTGLANCYVTLSAEEDPGKLLPQAREAVIRALKIDNNLAAAHASLGWIKWIYELDAAGAQNELEHSLKLHPNFADAHYRYARMLADIGRFDEAHAQAKQAIETDPLSIQYRKGVPYILYLARRYDEAIVEYKKVIEMAPTFSQAQRELGLAYEQKGMYQKAFSQLQKTQEMPENYSRTMTQADLGHLYAVWGKRTQAQQVLAELVKKSEHTYVSAYDIALIYAGLGDTEQAFHWLDKAIKQRPYWLCWLKLDPRLDGLRADSRFRDLLQHLGLSS